MKNTVNQVIAGKTPTHKKSLFKLTEHGFVIKENDRYQMRVPIFAEWIKRFAEVID
jgi:hypothetical protein